MGKFLAALVLLLVGSVIFAAIRKFRGGRFFDSEPGDPRSLKELAERSIAEKSGPHS